MPEACNLDEGLTMRSRSVLPAISLMALVIVAWPGDCLADVEKVVLVAGGGDKDDGSPATEAKLSAPFGVDFYKAGNTYVVEMQPGHSVRKVDTRGRLTTIAGTGAKGDAGDGGPTA